MIDFTNLFEAVPVEKEMPPIGEKVSVSLDGGKTFSYEAYGKKSFNNPKDVIYTHWLRPIPRERIEEDLIEFANGVWFSAVCADDSSKEEYDLCKRTAITELINQILGSCSQPSIGDKH